MLRKVSLALGSVALLLGCGKGEKRTDSATGAAAPATGATAASAAATPSAPALTLAQLEGTWRGQTLREAQDTVIATWTLSAPADTSKWVASFTKGPKVPVHIVSLSADSLVAKMGPYPSVSMKGKMITVQFVSRVHGDSLVGTEETHLVSKPDSVARGRLQATRAK
jgi:hypothetical protein